MSISMLGLEKIITIVKLVFICFQIRVNKELLFLLKISITKKGSLCYEKSSCADFQEKPKVFSFLPIYKYLFACLYTH